MKDLFGHDQLIDRSTGNSSKSRSPQPKGYAAQPGSGPEGETCKSCRHARCHVYAKRYWKCALVKPTKSTTTDIRLKWAACSRWEKDDDIPKR